MSDIFLSYAKDDLARVRTVVKALEARGWSVWWDPAIGPGETWDEVIEAALGEARCVIVLWSRNSVQSGWVRTEAEEGQRRGVLIPALLDEVVIPLAFRRIQAANLLGWSGALPHAGFEELARAVSKKVPTTTAPPATSAAAAAAPPTRPVDKVQEVSRTGTSPQQPVVAAAPESWWSLRRRVIAISLAAVAVIGAALYAGKGKGPAVSRGEPPNAAAPPGTQARENQKDSVKRGLEVAGAASKYVLIHAGTFQMGCSPGDTECNADEKPVHKVTLTHDFYMGETDVTVGAYRRFAEETRRTPPQAPSFDQTPEHPVVNVSWQDAADYCKWDGNGRLPTEAEWEYAARAGTSQLRYGNLDEIAWYETNSGGGTHPVAQKKPNNFGLYDLLGNVWQWTADWYDAKYYEKSPAENPQGPGTSPGGTRSLRGGSWNNFPRYVRVSYRNSLRPGFRNYDFGFRCVREVP